MIPVLPFDCAWQWSTLDATIPLPPLKRAALLVTRLAEMPVPLFEALEQFETLCAAMPVAPLWLAVQLVTWLEPPPTLKSTPCDPFSKTWHRSAITPPPARAPTSRHLPIVRSRKRQLATTESPPMPTRKPPGVTVQ